MPESLEESGVPWRAIAWRYRAREWVRLRREKGWK